MLATAPGSGTFSSLAFRSIESTIDPPADTPARPILFGSSTVFTMVAIGGDAVVKSSGEWVLRC